jgi:hypothetical protein
MARAGFYAISSSRITFGRDGRWYSDGEPIVNRRIADLFSRHVRRHPDGGYQIVMGDEHARIEVEDTPFVVTSVSSNAEGFRLTLNDGNVETLDPATLRVEAGEVLSCAVKGGTERARFLRAAYYQLVPFIGEDEGGRFSLHSGTKRYRLARG